MPTYANERTFREASGLVVVRFVVSDTVAGLEATATDVECLDLKTYRTSTSTESFVADEVSFDLDPDMIRQAGTNADDIAAFNFILDAQDVTVNRFAAVYYNPSVPPLPEEARFIGKVDPNMSGEDTFWSGSPYETDVAIARKWSCSCGAYDVETALAEDLEPLIAALIEDEGVGSTWIADTIADRPGYFTETVLTYFPGGVINETHEARWANLGLTWAILSKVIDLAGTTHGLTITLAEGPTGHSVLPARFKPLSDTGRNSRYCWDQSITWQPYPFYVSSSEAWQRAELTSDPDDIGALWTSWRILQPPPDEKEHSWLRYSTVAELLGAVAFSLNCFIKMEIIDIESVELSFVPRADFILPDPITFKDVEKGSINIKELTVDKADKIVGSSWPITNEGWAMYNYDGRFKAQTGPSSTYRPNGMVAPTDADGTLLALTCSPTWCYLEHRGDDGFDVGDQKGFALIPHNVVFANYPDGDPYSRGPKATGLWPQSFAEYNREAVHSGMYITTVGGYDEVGHTGSDKIVLPVAVLGLWSPDISGEVFRSNSEFLNRLLGFDRASMENEYSIDVPFIGSFKKSGVDDPMNVQTGTPITIEGADWIITAFDVDYEKGSTKLMLDSSERFEFTHETTNTGIDVPYDAPQRIQNSTTTDNQGLVFKSYQAGEDILLGNLVIVDTDGLLYNAQPIQAHYGKIVGVAAGVADDDEGHVFEERWVKVQTSGKIRLGVTENVDYQLAFSLYPTPLYLRASASDPYWNISDIPLTGITGSEVMYMEIGKAISEDVFVLELGLQFIYE